LSALLGCCGLARLDSPIDCCWPGGALRKTRICGFTAAVVQVRHAFMSLPVPAPSAVRIPNDEEFTIYLIAFGPAFIFWSLKLIWSTVHLGPQTKQVLLKTLPSALSAYLRRERVQWAKQLRQNRQSLSSA